MTDLTPSKIEPTSSRIGSVIVVGIVRNIEKSFSRDFERINKVLNRFSTIDWHVVESGSEDASVDFLESLAAKRHNFTFNHLELHPTLSRTENMAIARNSYLKFLRAESRLDKYEYVIVADFNNLNKKLTANAIESCFSKDTWDVLTANQQGRYYDAWALRHPLWSPNDCWEQYAFYRKYVKLPETAITYSMRSRMLRISSNSEWIEVDSAFGGLAIYKSAVLNSRAFYVGVTHSGMPVCEHVPFHSTLKSEGARIFINPGLINTRITDHSRRLTPLFTLLRICRYPVNLITKSKQNA
jgi:glycosyltransferase involved in cell wall biosynthesis